MNDGVVLSRGIQVRGGGVYPSMQKFLPPRLHTGDSVRRSFFSDPNCRLVIGVVVSDGQSVYLIHPAKAPATSLARICPQEKVKYRDGHLLNTILRGLEEELGLRSRDVELYPDELFRFENHVPLDRTAGKPETKCIAYFAVRVPKEVVLVPNPKEVQEVICATEGVYLEHGLASNRHKCLAQTEALVRALDVGVIDRQHWPIFSPVKIKTGRVVH